VSIVNGSLDLKQDLLDALNLTNNPFVRTEPAEGGLDRIFVGRDSELRTAAMRLVDRPRNLLVWGGYGCGKTTFVRVLLHELRAAKKRRFLTGYAPLVEDTAPGFQRATLTALCEGAREAAEPGPLLGFATETLETLNLLPPDGVEVGAMDLRFRRGLKLAHEAGFYRVVLAVDEIEKHDARRVQAMLLGSRFLLDQGASFVLTGRYLDAFSDVRASLLAAFDHRIDLKPLANGDLRQILRKNLALARRLPEPDETFSPFDDEVIAQMVARSRGIPRPLNLMACAALEQALDEAAAAGSLVTSVTAAHLASALEHEGNLIYAEIGPERRRMLEQIYRRSGYVSGVDLDAVAPSGMVQTIQELDELSRLDAVLRFEAGDGAAFSLSPPVEQSFRVEDEKLDGLRALWKSALSAPDKTARGKALEDFAAALFGEAFTVAERNLRTDTEELDIVLEPLPVTDSRFRRGPYLLVECKNWQATKVPQEVVTKLVGELKLHHIQQGFLVATGGFTSDAWQQARYANAQDMEIVLIDGHTITDFLAGVRPVGDLLVELHRRQILRSG
jgi:hypothetical protein